MAVGPNRADRTVDLYLSVICAPMFLRFPTALHQMVGALVDLPT